MSLPYAIVAVIASLLLTTPAGASATAVEWEVTPNHRGVAILVHGLNNPPGVMRPIAAALRSIGFTTGVVTLNGHGGPDEQSALAASDWIDAVRRAATEAAQRYPAVPLLGLGFSLGGAVCLRALDDGVDFRRVVFIAPAIELKGYTSFLRLVTWLRLFGVTVPSFIPAQYRSASTTPLDHYAFLFEIVDALRTHPFNHKTLGVPGLVILRETDEFISLTRTDRFRRESGFRDWRIVTLREAASELPGHLMVDERSFGPENWRRFLEELTDFLRDF